MGSNLAARFVAASDLVVTRNGLQRAAEVVPGDALLTLRGDGRMRMTEVSAAKSSGRRRCLQVLTEVGSAFLPECEPLVTTNGPVMAPELRQAWGLGRSIRVESLRAQEVRAELRTLGRGRVKLADRARGALYWLGRDHVAIPSGSSNAVVERIAAIFKAAGVAHEVREDERWLSWTFDHSSLLPPGPRCVPHPQDLLALASWEPAAEARTQLSEASLRSAIVLAHAWHGSPVKMAWVPGYHPVEARFATAAPGPFVRVAGLLPAHQECMQVTLMLPGAVIAGGLALGRLA